MLLGSCFGLFSLPFRNCKTRPLPFARGSRGSPPQSLELQTALQDVMSILHGLSEIGASEVITTGKPLGAL